MGDYRCFSLSNYFIICLLRLIFLKSWRRNIWSNVEQWQWHPPRDLSPLRQTELEEKATVRGSAGTWPRVSSCPSWAAAHMTAERGVQSQLWLSRPSPSPEKVTSLKFSCRHLNRADAQSWARQHQRQGGGGTTQTKPVNLLQRNLNRKSQSVDVAPQWLFSVGNAYRASEIKKD